MIEEDDLVPNRVAPQHGHAPRPLPLFLELVRRTALEQPDIARDALAGLRRYEAADRPQRTQPAPATASTRGVSLRDYGGNGSPVVLVPSLINPPSVLDLDPDASLAGAVRKMGRRAYLIDWGTADERSGCDVSAHVAEFLVPLLESLDEPPAMIGYCLGGTMAIAAANMIPVERVVTLAAPWHFSRYPEMSRRSLANLWAGAKDSARSLGALPMEVLQAAFWSLDPERTVRKFADFERIDAGSAKARRFVALEDWSNEGEPLPYAAARELIEDMFEADLPGRGQWTVAGVEISDSIGVPLLNFTAEKDSIAPAATAPHGPSCSIASGHVGMVVGSVRTRLHEGLANFLARD